MPLPSGQISQMVSGQMGMFANQANYAQQIGASHGVLPPGVGGQGQSFGRTGYQAQAVGPMGMISNSSIGGMGASMVGSMGGAMRGVGQAVDLFGLGTGLASMFPGTMGAMGMSSGMVAGMGAASLAALPIGLGLGVGGGNLYQGAQNISQVGAMGQAYFGPQFGQPGARPGGQMGRGQIQQITSILHEIAGDETMASMSDMKKLMDQAGQMGMLTGIGNAEQFRSRFRQMVSGVRELAKVMGSTFEEAAPLFGQMRQMGVWRPEDIMGTATAMRVAGPQGAPQLMQTMAAGAQGSFARGGLMASGAATGRAQFGIVQEAVRSGLISQQGLMELTGGVGGAEGQRMVAQELTGVMQNMSQTAAGRLAMAGLGEMQNGRFTGRLDEKLLRQFQSGGVTLNDLQRRGMRATSNRAGAASFTAHQDVLGQNLAAEGGMEMTANLVTAALDKAGFGEANEDIQQIMIQQMFGMGSRQAQLLQKMMANLPEIQERRAERTKAAIEDSFRRADEKMNRSWEGFTGAIGEAFEDQFTRPIQEAGERMTTRANEAIDRITDRIWGRTRQVKTTRRERLQMLQGGELRGAQARLRQMAGQDLSQRPLEEILDTPLAESVRRGGLGALVGMGDGQRGDIAKFLGAPTRREDPGFLVRMGAAFMGEDLSTETDIELGTRDIQGRATMASRADVRHALQAAQRRSRSDFTAKKAFGDSLETIQSMATLKTAYQSVIRSPEGQNKIREARERGASETEIARIVEGMMRGNGPAMDALLKLHRAKGTTKDTLAQTALDAVVLAAQDAGDPAAGIRREKMAGEVGVLDVTDLAKGSERRNEFVEKSIDMAMKTERQVLRRGFGKHGIDRMVTVTTEFEDVSREELAGVLSGPLAEDVARFLKDPEDLSPELARIRDAGEDNPINRIINEAQRKPGLKEGFMQGAARMGALKRGDVSREALEQRKALASRELRDITRVEGLRGATRESLSRVLRMVSSGEEADFEEARGLARTLASTLTDKEAQALVAGGGAFGGQVAAMQRAQALKLEGVGEAAFRKRVRRVSQAAGFDVFGSLSEEHQKELLGMFEEGSAGGVKMSEEEATRAKALVGKLTGIDFAQEQRSAREETNDKMTQKLREYTDANTAFVRAVDVALGGKLKEATTTLLKKGDEVKVQSTQ